MYQLYKITNEHNNKYYIGVHKGDIYGDDYYGSGLLIKRAIAKYGKDSFTREVLREYGSKNKAYSVERRIVNATLVEDGNCYNLMEGGISGPVQPGNKNSEGIEPWNKGMKLPQYSKHNHPRSIFSKEDREHICDIYKDGKTTTTISEMYNTSRSVICKLLESEDIDRRTRNQYDFPVGEDHQNWIDKGEDEICRRYKNGESTYEIADSIGTNDVTILNVLNRNDINSRGNKKSVMQFLPNGIFVGVYESAAEASRISNTNRAGICSTCNGNQKTSNSFKWRHVNYGW